LPLYSWLLLTVLPLQYIFIGKLQIILKSHSGSANNTHSIKLARFYFQSNYQLASAVSLPVLSVAHVHINVFSVQHAEIKHLALSFSCVENCTFVAAKNALKCGHS
jgi:hypothetical protein